uniref:Uncharacterized protein n=1 Tax=Caenorhabditis japonica TaxID=281687 RepID=A0A8R1EU33_CAEJA
MAKINSTNQRLSWTGAHVTFFGHLSIRSLRSKKRRILISIFKGYDHVCRFVHTIRIGGHIANSSTPRDQSRRVSLLNMISIASTEQSAFKGHWAES